MKLTIIIAYDINGVTATDRVPQGTSVTGAYYKLPLQNGLHPKIHQRRPDILAAGVLILHDDAMPHIALSSERNV